MEYPGTKFTRPIRRALLIVFITIFFVATPTIIAYTVGYRYDWGNGFWKAAGAISIDVDPQQTVLFLNGLKSNEKIPIRLNNISQGKYEVRLTADGYYDWNKSIEILDKKTQSQVSLWDSQMEKTKKLFAVDTGENLEIKWAPKSDCFFITDQLLQHKKMIVYCLPNQQINLYGIESSTISNVQWSDGAQTELFYGMNDEIVSYLPITGQKRIIAKNTY